WTARRLSTDDRSRLEQFWQEHLSDAPGEIELPRDFPRPLVGNFRGARMRIALSDTERQAGRTLARSHGATTSRVPVAPVRTWLRGYRRQGDIVIGGVTAGRDHSSVEQSIGNFANMVALRCRLDGDPAFEEVVSRTSSEIRSVVDHAALSFPEVVNAVSPAR